MIALTLTEVADIVGGRLADITPAVGIANAYDAMHLSALAIEKAGSTDGTAVVARRLAHLHPDVHVVHLA